MSSGEDGREAQAKPIVPVGEFVVGTILPFAGISDENALAQHGWLMCNGRALSRETYGPLFAVIGTLHGGGDGVKTFNLPDYRGWFLRGVDDDAGRDPDASERTAAAPGGQVGDNCGTEQGHATAAPKAPFTLSVDGVHTHTVQHIPDDCSSYVTTGSQQARWNPDWAPIGHAGEHWHVLAGGDPESRPLNAYVSYLIKYRT